MDIQDQPPMIFTKRRALLGFVSYIVLVVIVSLVFLG